MRKGKGYQKEGPTSNGKSGNSWARGKTESIDTIEKNCIKAREKALENCKKAYEIAEEYAITNTDLYQKYKEEHSDNILGRYLRFDWNRNSKTYLQLLPLEYAIKCIMKAKYMGPTYDYQKRIVNKDNQKFVYNSGSGSSAWPWARIPSLKRSKKVWKNFYDLFPYYEELSHDPQMRRKYGLKKIN